MTDVGGAGGGPVPGTELLLGFRFGVFFFAGGAVPNPLDIRFQRVSGLSTEVGTQSLREGGQNLYVHQLPEHLQHGNLVLERGMVVGSPLDIEVTAALSLFKFAPANVLVTLFDDAGQPAAGWLFIRTFPVRWSTSDLDAQADGVVVDTLELAYARMQLTRL